jgi:hypothetical protein
MFEKARGSISWADAAAQPISNHGPAIFAVATPTVILSAFARPSRWPWLQSWLARVLPLHSQL